MIGLRSNPIASSLAAVCLIGAVDTYVISRGMLAKNVMAVAVVASAVFVGIAIAYVNKKIEDIKIALGFMAAVAITAVVICRSGLNEAIAAFFKRKELGETAVVTLVETAVVTLVETAVVAKAQGKEVVNLALRLQ
jgi:hypothetical protein